MVRPRVSIFGLMGVVLICAVGVAALRAASALWAGGVLLLTLTVLGVTLLGAIFRRGARRAFWVGFALFGWGYLILACGPWFGQEVRPNLATSLVFDMVYARMHAVSTGEASVDYDGDGRADLVLAQGPLTMPGMTIAYTSIPWLPGARPFARIGHCLFALLAGGLGGMLGRFFFTPRDDEGGTEVEGSHGRAA